MVQTPQQMDMEDRRPKEAERKLRDLDWRELTRSEDLDWRTANRKEDLAWRQAARAEDASWRETQLRNMSDETRLATRRYALLAATQSVASGSNFKDVLKLAVDYAAWIESRDKVKPG